MKKCTRCGQKKEDVRSRVDPYQEDVEGKVVKIVVCDQCEREIADDI